MGLRERLREFAARSPRPFVVSAADGTGDRLAVEAELRARRWRPAVSPAETGVLVVCGHPGAALAEAIDVVWSAMPGPRARIRPDELDGIEPDGTPRDPASDDAGMADRADDRDGLRLDVLHVPLGPVLADWPAGLRLDLALQGDVVQSAEAVVVDAGGGSFWAGREAARRLDGVARFLRVAGWADAARRAAVLRDDVLDGRPVRDRFEAFERTVRRSRLLRWMTRGVGVLAPDAAERHGVPAWCAGDAADRLDAWLREIRAALDGGRTPGGPDRDEALVSVLPALVTGADLGQARLIVASLDPDLAAVTAGA
ncbi:hypothetical protein [Actinomadura verrucosospora]|uniref:Uncharacterized protein n=1 Tax=Actinomadura verrucosospora TaxID=46165 RepID=A0A7D4ATZ4_ACTVE|nr:hypothetical protein [Actinomadura verrucosospora]QKG25948.1 hypothetical protein ACTIVE_7601 [Actinomadura verrucosospora]